MEAWKIDVSGLEDLAPLLMDEYGKLQAVPAQTLARTSPQARLRFGVMHGIYGFLTHELIDWLRAEIGGRSAIEIGAGHGEIAAALGIPATDNRQQEKPSVRAHYAARGQPTVRYGRHVEKLDAMQAIERYRPQVVLASWVTHRYRADQPAYGGSESGIDEEAVIQACDTYILIGNTHVHRHKSIWALPHQRWTPPWLFSRAINGSPDFIAVWRAQR